MNHLTQILLRRLSFAGIRKQEPLAEEELFRNLLRDDVSKTVLLVEGFFLPAFPGAERVQRIALQWFRDHREEAEVWKTGSCGLFSEGVIVTLYLPGKKSLSFGNVTPENITEILQSLCIDGKIPQNHPPLWQSGNNSLTGWDHIPDQKEYPFFALQTARLSADCGKLVPSRIEEYLCRGGYSALAKVLHTQTPAEVRAITAQSGLTGRSTSAVSVMEKWNTVCKSGSPCRYVICDQTPTVPFPTCDSLLMYGNPHLILEGIMIAAYAVGASEAWLAMESGDPRTRALLMGALRQAEECGLTGENILDSGFSLKIHPFFVETGIVCGEETALIEGIEGRCPVPAPVPPYPCEKGLYGKPTLIHTAETFADITWIAAHGAEAFRSAGTAVSPGTKLLTFEGKFRYRGIGEFSFGTPVGKILFESGGGSRTGKKIKGILSGSLGSGVFPLSALDLPLDPASFRKEALPPGNGFFYLIEEDECIIHFLAQLFRWFRQNGCGKCIPCREGVKQFSLILESLMSREERPLLRLNGVLSLERIAWTMENCGLCPFSRTTAKMIRSSIRYFRADYEEHLFDRYCSAGVCFRREDESYD